MIVYGGSVHAKEIVYILLLKGINFDKIVDADPATGFILESVLKKFRRPNLLPEARP